MNELGQTIVFQAYGLENIAKQTIFAIDSILSFDPESKFIIVTDNQALFEPHLDFLASSVTWEVLPLEKFQEWRGEIDFVHRVKIEALKHVANKYRPSKILYLDSDVYATDSLESVWNEISDHQFLMHTNEGRLNSRKNPIFKKLEKFFKKNPVPFRGEYHHVDLKTPMWNAGAIGIEQKHYGLFDEILEFTDFTYKLYAKHVMEQFAVSFVLQASGTVQAVEKQIFHYWDRKQFDEDIEKYLEQKHRQAPGLETQIERPSAENIIPKKKIGRLKKISNYLKGSR